MSSAPVLGLFLLLGENDFLDIFYTNDAITSHLYHRQSSLYNNWYFAEAEYLYLH